MQRFRNLPYFVSEDGNVYREGKDTPLKPDVAPKGYRRVTLCIEGKTQRLLVHRMVAEVYLPRGQDDIEVNHKDNVPGHDWKDNLEWTTKSGNQIYAHRQGRCANLLASQQASVNKMASTVKEFKDKLGNHFIEVINKKPRNHVKFTCAECLRELICRADSSIFTKLRVTCRYCE